MVLLKKLEVAKIARVSPRTVDLWTQSGRLKVVKVGRLNRFLVRDLERFMDLKAGTLAPAQGGASSQG